MSTCQVRSHFVDFEAHSDLTERQIACRMSMLAGTSGPLSWEDGPGLPAIADRTEHGHLWFLGNGFSLAKTGPSTFRLSHQDAKVESLREFLEWIFESQYR